MCKTYDAIFEIRKSAESSYLILWTNGMVIKGELYCCDNNHDCKCLKDIITLHNVVVYCQKSGEEYHYKWLNVPSAHVKAFAFECCVME